MTKAKTTKPVRCETCNITLNSEQQAKQHFNGKSHLKKLRQQSAPADEKKKSADGDESAENKTDGKDEEKTDDNDNDKSSSTKPCSVSTDDDATSASQTTESTESTLTVAPSAGGTEMVTSESSECPGPKNQSGMSNVCNNLIKTAVAVCLWRQFLDSK